MNRTKSIDFRQNHKYWSTGKQKLRVGMHTVGVVEGVGIPRARAESRERNESEPQPFSIKHPPWSEEDDRCNEKLGMVSFFRNSKQIANKFFYQCILFHFWPFFFFKTKFINHIISVAVTNVINESQLYESPCYGASVSRILALLLIYYPKWHT